MTLLSATRSSLLFLAALGLAAVLVLAANPTTRSTLESASMNIFGLGSRTQPGSHQSPPAKRDPNTPRYSASAYDITPLTEARVQELAKKLTPDETKVILRAGTEPAFCGNLTDNKLDGVYICHLCGLPLFKSDSKFHSGTGWPSFFQPVDPAHIDEITDDSFGMERTEILCTRCHAHLGHVFNDGPKPTGLRYCVNSVSLEFVENGKPLPPAAMPVKTETAYFAGGCFWGTEDLFQQVPGVIDAVSGYMGGTVAKPSYDKVCEHNTGHAETVKIVYDPARISYETLLADFFKFHNPTTLNRQGPDVGDQYRSAIFTTDDAQLKAANAFIQKLQASDKYKNRKIVTVVQPAANDGQPAGFWKAEDYHQDYHMKHGGHCAMPEE